MIIKVRQFNVKNKPKMKCYEKRSDKLIEIGYSSYQDYLKSEEWKEIRNKKLNKFPICLICSSKSSQVHHMSYDCLTLLGVHLHRLVALCGVCHEKIEFDGKRKRTVKEANKCLFHLAEQNGKENWIKWHNGQHKLARTKKGNKHFVSKLKHKNLNSL